MAKTKSQRAQELFQIKILIKVCCCETNLRLQFNCQNTTCSFEGIYLLHDADTECLCILLEKCTIIWFYHQNDVSAQNYYCTYIRVRDGRSKSYHLKREMFKLGQMDVKIADHCTKFSLPKGIFCQDMYTFKMHKEI